jgi:hypothetical protein
MCTAPAALGARVLHWRTCQLLHAFWDVAAAAVIPQRNTTSLGNFSAKHGMTVRAYRSSQLHTREAAPRRRVRRYNESPFVS